MRDIEFQYIYKGLPFSSGNTGFNWVKKVYSLSQIERGIGKICDVHNDLELMAVRQYTGLKDKNGVKIFERDIIQVPDSDDYLEPGDVYEVYFAYGGFRMKPKINPQAKGYWLEDDCEFLVLGNMHQNPELVAS